MAQKVQVILVDDIDGGPADETLSFSLDGVSYEIDLSTANAAKLRDAFAPYVGTARRVGGRSAAGRGRARRGPPATTAPPRSASGPAPTGTRSTSVVACAADIVAAYDKAHA